jgi:hypothetical protein
MIEPRNDEDIDLNGGSRPWSHRRQEVGVIVWSSFLAACFATMVFFAYFDPMLLGNDADPPEWLSSSMAGYAFGFFFFWIVTALSAWLTAYLLDTLPKSENTKDKSATGRTS